MSNKKTLVMGASEKEWRYSYLAITRLLEKGHEVVAIGARKGKINEMIIETGFPDLKNIDTITIYLSEKNQKAYHEYVLNLGPRRIIFNPGAENKVLFELANKNGIETAEACTLVMLSTGEY